jgi:aromatic-L-amino-acid decarboxylase
MTDAEALQTDWGALDPQTEQEWAALRRAAYALIDGVIERQRALRNGPVWQSMPQATRAALAEPVSQTGLGIEAALARARALIEPYGTGNLHPRFWGWVLGAGNLPGMLGQWLSAAMNANVWAGDQGPAHLEQQLIGWFRHWFDFPDTASGLLVDGASTASTLALAIARQRISHGRIKHEGNAALPGLRVYCSSATHNSIVKAAALLGLGTSAVRQPACLPDGRADVAAIARELERDRAAGLTPFCLVGNAGTVGTGALDPLRELRELADQHGLWFHVDGAIGAIACLSPALRPLFDGMEQADSLAFDLHKWAQVPYDAGCLLVRDAALHRDTFAVEADYLGALSGGLCTPEAPAFNTLGPQLSRTDRALKIWLTFNALGVQRIAAVFERNVAQAQRLAAAVERSPLLELLAPVSLNIVCFRARPAQLAETALDALNEHILVSLQQSGLAVLSPFRMRGQLCLRASINNHRTQDRDIDLLVPALEALVASAA